MKFSQCISQCSLEKQTIGSFSLFIYLLRQRKKKTDLRNWLTWLWLISVKSVGKLTGWKFRIRGDAEVLNLNSTR